MPILNYLLSFLGSLVSLAGSGDLITSGGVGLGVGTGSSYPGRRSTSSLGT